MSKNIFVQKYYEKWIFNLCMSIKLWIIFRFLKHGKTQNRHTTHKFTNTTKHPTCNTPYTKNKNQQQSKNRKDQTRQRDDFDSKTKKGTDTECGILNGADNASLYTRTYSFRIGELALIGPRNSPTAHPPPTPPELFNIGLYRADLRLCLVRGVVGGGWWVAEGRMRQRRNERLT